MTKQINKVTVRPAKTGFESSLGTQSFCWFCHVMAHLFHYDLIALEQYWSALWGTVVTTGSQTCHPLSSLKITMSF